MVEVLRALRLGAINVFGIAVPGFLMIFFSIVSFLLPAFALAIHLSGHSMTPYVDFAESQVEVLLLVILLFAYVSGYVLRLASPDRLDEQSARRVLNRMPQEERDMWPYTGGQGDKFPYFEFRRYLKARKLDHLLPLVRWGADGSSDLEKRSKTAIHIMKLDIMMASPELAALVDSNEAHIRLLSGTWLALRATAPLVIAGTVVSLLALVYADATSAGPSVPPYGAFAVVNTFLLGSMAWAYVTIKKLFHYRRVSELVHIVQCAYLAQRIHEQEGTRL